MQHPVPIQPTYRPTPARDKIRNASVPQPTRASIRQDALECGRRNGRELVDRLLFIHLNDIGFFQENEKQSGFQYLTDVLESCFTDGLPDPHNIGIEEMETIDTLETDDFVRWRVNLDIIRAVKSAIDLADELRIGVM